MLTTFTLLLILATPTDEPVGELHRPTATAAVTETRTVSAVAVTNTADDPWAGVITWASYWHTVQTPARRAEPTKTALKSVAMKALTVVPHLDRVQTLETAAEMQAAMDAELAVDAVLATRAGQRLVLSALLCEAVQRKSDCGDKLEVILRDDVLAADKRTDRDIKRVRDDLARRAIAPLSCDTYPVERIVNCLGLLPSAACTEDDELAVQVHAAEKLAAP